ncbi:hypothetical protein Ocin01_11112 [Orchesella cincta]|uniref:Uncharacterized protein n=1 Tax=Orchesella cincta TaxID=48709 RepID=A0A1D2MR59_ORCCI|nr:hypothetical protein Ocin01_11112 [Orchesella cincta]
MLVKYWLPVAVLVAAQVVWTSWASAPDPTNVNSEESKEVGETADLEAQELFLRPVVIKYGHDHPAVYTWQGASGQGQGWGVYSQTQNQGLQQGGQQPGWGWPPKKGWGKEKKKKKKKKGKKKKKKAQKKKKKAQKKKNKAWKKSEKKSEKKKGGDEGGWGQVEEPGWGGESEKGGKKKGGEGGWGDDDDDDDGGGWGKEKKKKSKKSKKKGGDGGWGDDDDDDDGGGWGEDKKAKKKKSKKSKKKKGGGGWGDDDDDDGGGWSRSRQQNEQYRFNLAQGVQRFGGVADTVEYIPVVPADALPFQGFDGYFQDAYMI